MRALLTASLILLSVYGCTEFGPLRSSPTPTPSSTSTPPPTATSTPEPPPTSTPTPYVPPWPVLRRGDGGLAEVFALQRLLRQHGLIVIADGRFGAQTLKAVQDLQTRIG